MSDNNSSTETVAALIDLCGRTEILETKMQQNIDETMNISSKVKKLMEMMQGLQTRLEDVGFIPRYADKQPLDSGSPPAFLPTPTSSRMLHTVITGPQQQYEVRHNIIDDSVDPMMETPLCLPRLDVVVKEESQQAWSSTRSILTAKNPIECAVVDSSCENVWLKGVTTELVEAEVATNTLSSKSFSSLLANKESFAENDKLILKSEFMTLSTSENFCSLTVRQNAYERFSLFLPPEKPPDEFVIVMNGTDNCDAHTQIDTYDGDMMGPLNSMDNSMSNIQVFAKDTGTNLGRKELFKDTLRKMVHVCDRINKLSLTKEEVSKPWFFVDQQAYTDLHWGMFIPAIKTQGVKEQQAKWLRQAYKRQIVGCYAHTEMGHGSNVQGLETTATFNHKTDEFIIHSPTLISSKFWSCGRGKVSTHAVVYARLIINGNDYGVNGFIVQLRSLDDHSPLPGITVGVIGMKFGNGAYNSMDNGVLTFDYVGILRDQMLRRVGRQVTMEGKYVQSDVPRHFVYGTMVYVRKIIVSDASIALSRAVPIATRYSVARGKFGAHEGERETQVIDYKTQPSWLFTLITSAYAFQFASEWLRWSYTDVTWRLQANDFLRLPEAHACTAGLKSLTTSIMAHGIEECCKLWGGHGYLCSSALPELFVVNIFQRALMKVSIVVLRKEMLKLMNSTLGCFNLVLGFLNGGKPGPHRITGNGVGFKPSIMDIID